MLWPQTSSGIIKKQSSGNTLTRATALPPPLLSLLFAHLHTLHAHELITFQVLDLIPFPFRIHSKPIYCINIPGDTDCGGCKRHKQVQ